MRRRLAVVGLAALVSGIAVSFAIVPTAPTQAASSKATFTISAEDGYGIGDCVSSGSACARVVADAWCEAQGFARSASVDTVDVTGSIATASQRSSISITCAQ